MRECRAKVAARSWAKSEHMVSVAATAKVAKLSEMVAKAGIDAPAMRNLATRSTDAKAATGWTTTTL